MSPDATTWVIVGALVFAAFGSISVMVIRDVREPRGRDECGRKNAAYRTLVAAGRIRT